MNEKKHFSLIILMLVMALLCSYHIYYYFLDKTDNNLIRNYYGKEQNDINNTNSSIVKNMNNNYNFETKKNNDDSYLAVLNIPKINLIEGFYDINSQKNNINRSVTLLKESTMPSENGSIIYLAAHSGSGYLAYFNDLDKLAIDDIITINYQNNDYDYSVNDIYKTDKNGKIMVNHNINENYLVLTTCSKDENKQLVITSKLING